jgi:hypothetical protein
MLSFYQSATARMPKPPYAIRLRQAFDAAQARLRAPAGSPYTSRPDEFPSN